MTYGYLQLPLKQLHNGGVALGVEAHGQCCLCSRVGVYSGNLLVTATASTVGEGIPGPATAIYEQYGMKPWLLGSWTAQH